MYTLISGFEADPPSLNLFFNHDDRILISNPAIAASVLSSSMLVYIQ